MIRKQIRYGSMTHWSNLTWLKGLNKWLRKVQA